MNTTKRVAPVVDEEESSSHTAAHQLDYYQQEREEEGDSSLRTIIMETLKGFTATSSPSTVVLSPTSSLFSMSPGIGEKSNIGAFFQTCKVTIWTQGRKEAFSLWLHRNLHNWICIFKRRLVLVYVVGNKFPPRGGSNKSLVGRIRNDQQNKMAAFRVSCVSFVAASCWTLNATCSREVVYKRCSSSSHINWFVCHEKNSLAVSVVWIPFFTFWVARQSFWEEFRGDTFYFPWILSHS